MGICFLLVGLPDVAVKESRQRIESPIQPMEVVAAGHHNLLGFRG